MEFEGNENFFVLSLIEFFKNLQPDQLDMVCEYIVATWLNNNPTILKQSQIEKKITFMNQYNAGKLTKNKSPDRLNSHKQSKVDLENGEEDQSSKIEN